MEKVDKKEPAPSRPVERVGSAAVLSASQNVKPMGAIAEACFDLQSSEATGVAAPDHLVEALRRLLQANTSPQLIGFLGKCQLPGRDVHFLTRQQDILRHVEECAPIPPGFSDARAWWRSALEGTVALLVYTDRMEAVLIDGSIIPITTASR